MSGYWNGPSSKREFQLYQRPQNLNRFDNQPQFNNSYDNSNFPRFPRDPGRNSRPRNSFVGENNFNSVNRNYRERNWGRRSSSVPRNVAEDRGRWNQSRGFNRSRKKSFSYDTNNEKIEGEVKSNDHNHNQEKDSPQVPQLKKFRSIFVPDGTSTDLKVTKTGDTNHQLNRTVICRDLEKSTPVISDKNETIQNIISNSVELPPKSREYLKPIQMNDFTKYYGESLTDLNNEDLKLEDTKLPIVDWPKKSFSIDNIPEYDPSVSVGGDGLSLEVYYSCKYCKMFTGGSQINAHLKSRYHYNKYKEFLRTGHIASESSSSSSESSSECDSKTSKSPQKQVETQPATQTSMDIDDPSEIDYRCHQDLDFD